MNKVNTIICQGVDQKKMNICITFRLTQEDNNEYGTSIHSFYIEIEYFSFSGLIL